NPLIRSYGGVLDRCANGAVRQHNAVDNGSLIERGKKCAHHVQPRHLGGCWNGRLGSPLDNNERSSVCCRYGASRKPNLAHRRLPRTRTWVRWASAHSAHDTSMMSATAALAAARQSSWSSSGMTRRSTSPSRA